MYFSQHTTVCDCEGILEHCALGFPATDTDPAIKKTISESETNNPSFNLMFGQIQVYTNQK